MAEAANSAALLKGQYHCVGCDDIFILYDKPTILSVTKLVRQVKPTIVFTASPADYMLDHEITSRLARNACFVCGIPNIKTDDVGPFDFVPYLYYVDPLEGKDIFGRPVEPSIFVDISSVIETKLKMLCCHESQRSWLLAHHGVDEYTISMKNWSKARGQTIGSGPVEAACKSIVKARLCQRSFAPLSNMA
jgi:LmbE family N-acetylglucosaminyl deacetylase